MKVSINYKYVSSMIFTNYFKFKTIKLLRHEIRDLFKTQVRFIKIAVFSNNASQREQFTFEDTNRSHILCSHNN